MNSGARQLVLPAPALAPAMDGSIGTAPLEPSILRARDIERLLADRGDWRNGVNPAIRVTGPLVRTSFSRVFRGDGRMFTCPVAIKQFLWDPSGASPAETARTYFLGPGPCV